MGMSKKTIQFFSHELQYDFSKKNKGIYGTPFFWRLGASKDFSDNVRGTVQYLFGQRFWFNVKWQINLASNPNLTFTLSERMDLKNMFMDPKNANY